MALSFTSGLLCILLLLFSKALVVSARIGSNNASPDNVHHDTTTLAIDHNETQFDPGREEGPTETADKPSDRINNGQQSVPGEYPFYAQMWWVGYSQGCGGSLIASKWILTAAHCIDNFVDRIPQLNYPEWRVGAYCREASNCGVAQEVIRSKRGLVHPSFDIFVPRSDYALIELENPATTRPVDIDDGTVFASLQRGSTVRGLGFGILNDAGDNPFYLQKVDNSFVPLDSCRRRYTTGAYFDDSMLCTNGLNHGMCSGDSGSPVVVSDVSSPYGFKQVSVTSFGGPRCGNHDIPDVGARVSTIYSWIQDTVCPSYANDSDRPHYCPEEIYAPPPSLSPTASLCVDEAKEYTLYTKNKMRKCRKITDATKVQKLCDNKKSNALEKCRKSCGVC